MESQRDIGELIAQAKTGDNKAFQELYELTCSHNFYLIQKIVKNVSDAEDVLQDTWIKIYENLDQVRDTKLKSFVSWSGKVASNTALDFLRKKKPMLFSDMEKEGDSEPIPFEVQDYKIENQPELAFDQKQTSEIVQELLEGLSDDQRICVMMFYLQEMSIREIAENIGCSESTVKSRLSYARKKIQAQEEVLEKKGITLRGLAPLLLLGWLLRNEMANARTTERLARLGLQRWSQMQMPSRASEAGKEWMKSGGEKLAKAGMKKLVMALVSGTLVIIGVFGGFVWMRSQEESPAQQEAPSETVSPVVTEQPAEEPTPEVTEAPTEEPTEKPTPKPTKKPTPKPTKKTTPKPTRKPTPKQTKKPEKNPLDGLEQEDDPNDLDSGW